MNAKEKQVLNALNQWCIEINEGKGCRITRKVYYNSFAEMIDRARGVNDAIGIIGNAYLSENLPVNHFDLGNALIALSEIQNEILSNGIDKALDAFFDFEEDSE